MAQIRNTSNADINGWSGNIDIKAGETIEVADSQVQDLLRTYGFLERVEEAQPEEEKEEKPKRSRKSKKAEKEGSLDEAVLEGQE